MKRKSWMLAIAAIAITAFGYGCTTDPVKTAATGERNDFVGSSTCGACHQDSY